MELVVGGTVQGMASGTALIKDAMFANPNIQDEIGRATINNPDDPAAAAQELQTTFDSPDSFSTKLYKA